MDEKPSSVDDGFDEAYLPQTPSFKNARRRGLPAYFKDLTMRRLCYAMCVTLTVCLLLHTVNASYRKCRLPGARAELSNAEVILAEENVIKVALEAHIMSKCPDAKACLQMLVVPAMEQISDKVDFRLSYIGSVDPHSDAVSCMHGPPECLGNIILLCAAHLYPEPKLHLGFANCMIGDYPNIPDRTLVENCALEHSLSFEKINDCISNEDAHGINLLRKSVEWSRENNVTKSCTVRLAGKVRCIRDDGMWKDCEGGSEVDDLVRDVKELYDKANSVAWMRKAYQKLTLI